jgi:hypothetical protein
MPLLTCISWLLQLVYLEKAVLARLIIILRKIKRTTLFVLTRAA